MITLRRGYVGTAPGTSTLYLSGTEPAAPTPPASLTYEQYLARDIALRQESLKVQKSGQVWDRIGTFATASLTTLALLAAVSAWWRTGKLKVSR